MVAPDLTRTKAALAHSAAQGWDIGAQIAVWRDGAPWSRTPKGLRDPASR